MEVTGYDYIKQFKELLYDWEHAYNDLSTNKPVLKRLERMHVLVMEAMEYHAHIEQEIIDDNQLSLEI